MENFDLKKDPLILQWQSSINKPATQNLYLLGMKVYTAWLNKLPEDLITEAEEETKLLMRKRKIVGYLNGFKNYLSNQGFAPMTQKSYFNAVKSFYQFNYVELPKMKIDKAKPLRENKDIPTKEDMQEILKICDPLEKAVLLVGAASGLAANEIINLRISDFKYDKETGVTTLDLRRLKVDNDFYTFLTPEASRAVLDYLTYRNRTCKTKDPKRVIPMEKQRVVSDDGYLFITRRVDDKFLEDHNEEWRKLDKHAFMKIYRTISEKAQKNTPKGNWNLIRSHNIRKWFNTTLLNAGMGYLFVEELMGHTLPSTQEAYYIRNPEKLKEQYMKFIPFLTIQKELNISESPEYQRIKDENDILRAETARHILDRHDMNRLCEAIASIKFFKPDPEFPPEMNTRIAKANEQIIELKDSLLRVKEK